MTVTVFQFKRSLSEHIKIDKFVLSDNITSCWLKYKRNHVFPFVCPFPKISPIEIVLSHTPSAQVAAHGRHNQVDIEMIRNECDSEPANQLEEVMWAGDVRKKSLSWCDVFGLGSSARRAA
jgi:hypothetical protein